MKFWWLPLALPQPLRHIGLRRCCCVAHQLYLFGLCWIAGCYVKNHPFWMLEPVFLHMWPHMFSPNVERNTCRQKRLLSGVKHGIANVSPRISHINPNAGQIQNFIGWTKRKAFCQKMSKESPCSLVKLSMCICVLIKVAILCGSIADFCVFNQHLLLLKTPKSFTISHRNPYLIPFSTYFQWLNQQFF